MEVKSGDAPIDRPAVDKLLGAVPSSGAGRLICFLERIQEQCAKGTFYEVTSSTVMDTEGTARSSVCPVGSFGR